MASLKEVKGRIGSVSTTRKITLARQMVSSARLHRAQAALADARTYRSSLSSLLRNIASPAPEPRGREGITAVVILSSNSGMCGQFNAKMEKYLDQMVLEDGRDNLLFFPIGSKIRKALNSRKLCVEGQYDYLADKSDYNQVKVLAEELMARVDKGELARVEIVYQSFRSMSSQPVMQRKIYPIAMTVGGDDVSDLFIVEPSMQTLAVRIARMYTTSWLYASIVSSSASEHAARTVAMQLATDNADELLEELELTYNKLRQQNITSELLDIIGSSFA